MKLYYKPGACSLAVHIALNEIDAEFDLEKVDTAAQQTETGVDYSTINPNGYVPALAIDGGEVLSEGVAVLQYVALQRPDAGLAPVPGTIENTRLQALLNFVSSEFHKSFGPFFSPEPLEGEARKAAEAGVARRMDFIEATLGDRGSFLLGDRFSIADAYAFVVASWSRHVGIALDRWPNLTDYLQRIAQRPAVIKAMKSEGLVA